MKIHNHPKKEVRAVRKIDDQVGADSGRNAAVAVRSLQHIGMLEAARYRAPQQRTGTRAMAR